jgi:ATP-dependent helicase/nuclease subunit A
MSGAAYEVNGRVVDPTRFYEVACDPERSVVVEACAGAGKTWMLVSRIVRAWLEGTPPQQILAITFTRKAAGEMRERLHQWLSSFAKLDEAGRIHELRIRGVPEQMLTARAPRLAQLHQEWMESGRGVEIHTIHGWFSRLVKAAPLDVLAELSLPPQLQLVEDVDEIWAGLWGRFLRLIDASMMNPAGESNDLVFAFTAVLRETGRFNLEGWLREAVKNRLELVLADEAGVLEQGVPSAATWQPRWGEWASPLDALMSECIAQRLGDVARELGQASGSLAQAAARGIVDALQKSDAGERFESLRKALLTDKGDPRKKLGDSEALAWAQAWLQDLSLAVRQENSHRLHRHMVTLSRAFFLVYADFKRERGLADMADLELAAARLLCDESLSDWVLSRLDSQVRQLLMDEFQDTSPLQWKALGTWLSAYAGAGGSSAVSVFLVGDPKQSIYRFRRADPRVFQAAKRFVLEGLGGQLLACDHTRRNAPGVIDLLNQVMGDACQAGDFPGYRAHTTASEAVASVRRMARISRPDNASEVDSASLEQAQDEARDTLTQPREVVGLTTKGQEAERVAAGILELLEGGAHAPQDIFVLARTRAMLGLVARALDQFGVPHVAPDNTPLIDAPEVQDLLATVEVLVSPHHELALSHSLRSPIFGVSDDGLMQLAAQARAQSGDWWGALISLGVKDDAESGLQRAARLLPAWRLASQALPPHDLLTRILQEGEVRERVVAAVPAGQREQALFHVDALLRHSLEMDSGRDATPYRWVRALRQSVQPLPARSQAGAVQLLTIHGAKGLEAEVVFIVDTDPMPSPSMSHGILVDWPEGAAHPHRVAFVRSEASPPPALAEFLEAERQSDLREELNALYVAMTRARSVLVVSANEPFRRGRNETWWTRLTKAPELAQADSWSPTKVLLPLAVPLPAVLRVLPSNASVVPAPAAVDRISDQASCEESLRRVLGQVVHRALELLTTLPSSEREPARVAQAVHASAQALALPASHHQAALDRVTVILAQPHLQAWLDPDVALWAGNEVSLSHEGDVLRIDRLVAVTSPRGRAWWVIDYKLGDQPLATADYHSQMARYVAAVRCLQPGDEVHGAFITGSGQWVPWSEL